MKKLISVLTLVLGVLAAGAQEKTYTLNFENFDELQVVDGVNVDYSISTDSAGLVTFSAEPALADMLMFETGKGRLKIQVATDDQGPVKGLPTVRVYSAMLSKVENSGDSTVTVSLSGAVPSFKARVVGNGTVVVRGIYTNNAEGRISTGHGHLVMQGRAARVKLSNVGTGPIEAGALEAKEVKCWLLGTGPIDCFATENLSIVGAGSGKVYYKGNPSKVTNRTLGVKAIDLNPGSAEK